MFVVDSCFFAHLIYLASYCTQYIVDVIDNLVNTWNTNSHGHFGELLISCYKSSDYTMIQLPIFLKFTDLN